MTCWAVIPVKAAIEGKSRLAGILSPTERERLIRAMLEHVVTSAERAANVERVCLVGTTRHGLPESLPLLADPGYGLNAALHSAMAELAGTECTRMLIVAADLPQVSPDELQLLAAAPVGEIAIAPDRHGAGTNALSLPLPQAREFAFAFGPGSFGHHRAEAERLGLAIGIVEGNGLIRDVDEPGDLADADRLDWRTRGPDLSPPS